MLGLLLSSGATGPVTRSLTVKTGSPPPAGGRAALDQDVFTDPTEGYGVHCDEVTYGCVGGSCPAWFVPGTATTWAVMVHGKGGHPG